MRYVSSEQGLGAKASTDLTDTRSDKACVLVNPRSFRIHGGQSLDTVTNVARAAEAPVHVVQHPEDISSALAGYQQNFPANLIVVGGDGTVQAALSALAESTSARLPRILVLGGGRTNFTARDLGTHTKPLHWLKRALHNPEIFNTERRTLLSVEQPESGQKLHGFFIAGAMIDHIIRDCHAYRKRHQGWLRTGHPSSAWRVMQLAAMGLVGRSSFRPPPMKVDAGKLGMLDEGVRILILSSLEHRRGAINPYAPRGSGDVRLTAVTQRARRLWSRMPFLLQGRLSGQQTPETGYLSGRSSQVVVRGMNAACIDGQEYEFVPDEDVLIRPGPAFDFMVP
jgi:hypothetical protein